jgi:glycerol-3-phosphate dehydrogenase (NAD(P)+)
MSDFIAAGVIGAGAWGTALANVLADNGHRVQVWAREADVVSSINEFHENKHFLPGIVLSENISAFCDIGPVCKNKDLLLSVVPAQFVRSVFQEAAPLIDTQIPIVSASKGIETSSLQLLKDVFEEELPGSLARQLAFLSGPTFAKDVALQKPAAATLASLNADLLLIVQQWLSAPHFKVYTSRDVVGVEVGGAIKNIIAIAAGIVDGLQLGDSARAGMMTRGLNEMTRLGMALGADPLTFQGLAGLGDLILTCTGDLSRNRTMGLQLASGKTREEILGARNAVTEGVATAEAVHKLAKKLKLDLPICEEVYQVLFHDKSCAEAVKKLSSRALKEEWERA